MIPESKSIKAETEENAEEEILLHPPDKLTTLRSLYSSNTSKLKLLSLSEVNLESI